MPQKIYDIKTEKEITAKEASELLSKAIKEGKWEVAAYYNRLLARLIIEELRIARGGQATPST